MYNMALANLKTPKNIEIGGRWVYRITGNVVLEGFFLDCNIQKRVFAIYMLLQIWFFSLILFHSWGHKNWGTIRYRLGLGKGNNMDGGSLSGIESILVQKAQAMRLAWAGGSTRHVPWHDFVIWIKYLNTLIFTKFKIWRSLAYFFLLETLVSFFSIILCLDSITF